LWVREDRARGLLLGGEKLEEQARWAALHAEELSDEENEFLQASLEARDQEAVERRTARRLRTLSIGLAVIALLTLATCVVAAFEWWSADQARSDAVTQRVTAESALEEGNRPRTVANAATEVAQG